jgi:serine/threonine protein kinase
MLLRTDVPSRCLVLLRCIALQELMKRLQRAEYTLPDTASKELADFLALMIQPDPTKRLGAEEALKHPWVLADDQTEEQVDVSAKQASSCKRYPPCRLAHQLPACQLTFLVRSPPVSLVSYRIVSYRIVSYRIVSYRIVSYRIVRRDCCARCQVVRSPPSQMENHPSYGWESSRPVDKQRMQREMSP